MSLTGRETLCRHFADGELPTEEHFRELIESMLHMDDEGFSKSLEHGLEVTAGVNAQALMSFFCGGVARDPLWTLRLGDAGQQLGVHPGGAPHPGPPLLTLEITREGQRRVGIDTEHPQHSLHVDGVLGSRARAGTWPLPDAAQPPLADGGWHALTEPLTGLHAFEVVASASLPGQGHHGLLHAVAMNACNPTLGWFDRLFNRRSSIRAQHAWYDKRCDRLKLRWRSLEGGERYVLEIGTHCAYGDGVAINSHVTALWPTTPAARTPAGTAARAPGAGVAANAAPAAPQGPGPAAGFSATTP